MSKSDLPFRFCKFFSLLFSISDYRYSQYLIIDISCNVNWTMCTSIAGLSCEFGGHFPISSKKALDPSRWFKVVHMHSKWTHNHFPTKFVALGQSDTKL